VDLLGVEDLHARAQIRFAAVDVGPLRPCAERQDDILQDAELVAGVKTRGPALQFRLVGSHRLRAAREGVLVELVAVEVDADGELVVEAEELPVEDVAWGGAHRVDADLREGGKGGIVGGHLPPAVDQVAVEASVGAQDGFDEQVGVEEARAGVVVGVLGLPAVGRELGRRQGARELVVGLVVGDPQGDVEGIAGVVADRAARAFRGELGAVPVAARREALAAQRIVELVRRAPDAGASVVRVVAPADEGYIPLGLPLAALGDDVDGAGDGGIPVQHIACPAHHLDALDLRQRDLEPVDPGNVGAVQAPAVQQDHVAKVTRLRAERPHVHDGLRGVAAVAGDVDAHEARQHLGNARGARILDILGRDHRHVGRDLAHLLGVAGGRDDHLAHPVLGPGSVRRRLGPCKPGRGRDGQREKTQNDDSPAHANHLFSSFPLGNWHCCAVGRVYWLAAPYSPRLPGPLCR